LAGLRIALLSLRQADDVLRSRNKPAGALRGITAYLAGFAIIRTMANSYIFLSTLRPIASRGDAYGLAVLLTIAACFPLASVLVFSRSRLNIAWRLSSLPVRKADRIAIAALEPAVTALPVLALASLLPAIAALPIASWSFLDYLKAVLWYPPVTAAMALGLRSLAGVIESLLLRRGRAQKSQGRSIALAVVLLACALANPAPVVNGNGMFISLYASKLAVSEAGTAGLDLPLASGSGLAALVALAASLAFATLAALGEDAAQRRIHGSRVPAGRLFRTVKSAWPLAAVVDSKRDALWTIAAFLALAVLSLEQRAAPVVPLAVAAATIVIRSGSALAFIATVSPATRRFALIPAKPGAVDRAYLITAVALAACMAAPLAGAGLLLMGLPFR